MPQFIPFKALRPPRDKAHLVGSRSYLSYSESNLIDKLASNPFTFLHVVMPEGKYEDYKGLSVGEKFNVVKREFKAFVKNKNLIQDKRKAFYIYRQTKGGKEYVGIIGAVSAEDYENGLIKKHEQTLSRREKLFKRYLEVTEFNAEPVLLAYEDSDEVNNLVAKRCKKRPEYEYFTTDHVKHEMWLVKKKRHQDVITKEMSKLDGLYIADGHHRCASSALLLEGSDDNPKKKHFMAMLIPKSSLMIYDFNRLVKNSTGHSSQEILDQLSDSFKVSEFKDIHKPKKLHCISMYLDHKWYKITLKDEQVEEGVIEQLDTHVLSKKILEPILDIDDIRNDDRVGFLSGTLGLSALSDKVDSGEFDIAFALYPVSFEQLKAVSDAGLTMPPKSTWIEPKLRSGLTIYKLT